MFRGENKKHHLETRGTFSSFVSICLVPALISSVLAAAEALGQRVFSILWGLSQKTLRKRLNNYLLVN